jgi:uncharacterized protein (DUF1800 family)
MLLDDREKTAHLLRRAGFAARPEEIAAGVDRGLQATVDDLLNFERFPDVQPDSELINALPVLLGQFQGQAESFFNRMTQWWLNAMVTTQRPLQEKMVLFWHHLFATSVQGVNDVRQMYVQNENFRGNYDPDTGEVVRPNPASPFPVGNFRLLLEYLTKDSAMMFWLDNVTNRRLNPEVGSNENYARELHELFSMGVADAVTGEPNYTERDVRQASRALTGWSLVRRGANQSFPRVFFFDSSDHDFGPYDHLGNHGGNNADFIFDNLVEHRNPGQQQTSVGRFLGYRLFKFFGYNLDTEEQKEVRDLIINDLANVFDGAYGGPKYNIREMLRRIFTPGNPVSDVFYSERALREHVKSPTEYVVSAFRLLNPDGLPVLDGQGQAIQMIIPAMIEMGQQLFAPADVSGWKEDREWINTTFALARFNFANTLATQLEPAQGGIDVNAILVRHGLARLENNTLIVTATPEQMVDFFTGLMLQMAVSPKTRQTLIDYLNAPGGSGDFINMKVRGLIHLILAMPEFQLS